MKKMLLDNQLEINEIKNEIIKYTNFSLGKELIINEELILNPLVIKKKNNLVKDVLKVIVKYDTMPFLGIKNLKDEANKALKDDLLTPGNLLDFVSLNDGVKAAINYTYKFLEDYNEIINYTSTLVFHKEINIEILKAINDYKELRSDASPLLSQLTKDINKLDNDINKVAHKFMQDNSDLIQERIISYRNNRACILLKNQAKYSFKGLVHGQTSSKLAAYVEPSVLYELNNKKAILKEEYDNEANRILFYLSQLIKKYAHEIIANIDTLAILDMAFAKGMYGYKKEACVANLSNDKTLFIKDARHPLIDDKVVVSNTYSIDNDINLLLITGSNTGGKTVSLKVIGLFVIMTYLGIPVLADKANIPFFDQIFIDISDNQSVNESLSSFSSHLKVISNITNNVTNKSLVLLDEIASATDPKEGEALAIAVLDYLRRKNCLTICTTHYSGLKSYAKKHQDTLLASVEFDKILLKPTYRFLIGIAGQSNAFDIARRYNISDSIINDAIRIKNETKSDDERLLDTLEKDLINNQIIKNDLEKSQEKIKQLNIELENKYQQIEIEKENIIKQAKLEASKYLDETKEKASLLLMKIEEANSLKKHEKLVIKKEIEYLNNIEDDSVIEVNNEPIKVNDYVNLKNANHIGQVIEINKDKATVLLNGIRVNTKLKDLKKTNYVANKKEKKKVRKEYEVINVSLECNLIGLSYSEATEELSKYLDTVLAANRPYCRIVHGVGTGVLRKMTHELLKKHKQVKSFRLADYNDGGTGATFVEFK